jgi:TonB family protein
MSTNTAFQTRVSLPPMPEFVDTLTAGTSAAIASFDVVKLRTRNNEPAAASAANQITSSWMPSMPQPASGINKATSFALVVAAHVLAYFALVNLSPNFKEAIAAPLQVVMLAEVSTDDNVRPPLPQPRMQQFDLPVEPVILTVADPDATPITVVAQQQINTAPAQTTAVAAPKVVSSVDYVREPKVKYPPAARALKQRGTVTLRVLVDATGHAAEAIVHQSSGFRLLDDAARTAVLNALYKPHTENGRSQPVYVFVPIEFSAANT